MSGNTRTSPSDMVGAALVAKKAYDIGLKVSNLSFFYLVLSPGLGYNSCFFLFRLNNNSCFDIAIQVKPGVRTSVSPGYGIFNEYLLQRFVRKHPNFLLDLLSHVFTFLCSGLQEYLDKQGFQMVGRGFTTTIWGSGDLDGSTASAISENGSTLSFTINQKKKKSQSFTSTLCVKGL